MRYHLFFLASFAIFTVGFISDPEACYTDCIDDEATDVIRPEIIPTQPNPALAWSVVDTGTDGDPFAAFGRRPIDEPRIVPFGGFYQDPDRSTPHYGIDYTYPEAFLNFVPQPIYPIGPGIVTTVHTCPSCFAFNTGQWGLLNTGQLEALNNYGFGAMVIIEHPVNEFVSFYSMYAHLREIDVSMGQQVDSDTQLALLGGSGVVQAPHVHMEIRIGLPDQFWGSDLNNIVVMRRWLELRHETPVFLLFPEHHNPFMAVLNLWVEQEYPLQVPRDVESPNP